MASSEDGTHVLQIITKPIAPDSFRTRSLSRSVIIARHLLKRLSVSQYFCEIKDKNHLPKKNKNRPRGIALRLHVDSLPSTHEFRPSRTNSGCVLEISSDQKQKDHYLSRWPFHVAKPGCELSAHARVSYVAFCQNLFKDWITTRSRSTSRYQQGPFDPHDQF